MHNILHAIAWSSTAQSNTIACTAHSAGWGGGTYVHCSIPIAALGLALSTSIDLQWECDKWWIRVATLCSWWWATIVVVTHTFHLMG